MTHPSFERWAQERAEAHDKKVFANNPDGFTIAPWCNETTCGDSWLEGATATFALMQPLVKALEKIEKITNDWASREAHAALTRLKQTLEGK